MKILIVIGLFISSIQAPLVRALVMVLLALVSGLTISYTSGAISSTDFPLIHLSVQKKVLSPLANMTLAAALKRALVCSSCGDASSHHGLFSLAHKFQAHRTLKALLMTSRSKIPRPPTDLGRHTVGQLTRHFPPSTTSVPFHKKDRKSVV